MGRVNEIIKLRAFLPFNVAFEQCTPFMNVFGEEKLTERDQA